MMMLVLQDASLGEKGGGGRERKGEKERESFIGILSFLERFSPHVESLYIFYRALSLQTRENLSIFKFLSLSIPSPVSLHLRCLAVVFDFFGVFLSPSFFYFGGDQNAPL
jgi:hypothetical protein